MDETTDKVNNMTDEEFDIKATECALKQGFINGLCFCSKIIMKQMKREEDDRCKNVLTALGMALQDSAKEEALQLAADLEQFEQEVKGGNNE